MRRTASQRLISDLRSGSFKPVIVSCCERPMSQASSPLTVSGLPSERPAKQSYDVVIVGGGIMGSAIAWSLSQRDDFGGSILVIERDPSYEFASTSHTNSCIRQQFSTEINIRVSQYGVDFIQDLQSHMGPDPRLPDCPIQAFGYMYLANSETGAAVLRENQALQARCGAGTRLLTPQELAQAYPFYTVDDLLLASHNPVNEGYFEGATLFDWFRRLSREAGATFLANEVLAIQRDAERVTGVTLASGEQVQCGLLVNASGPRAAATAAMAGLSLPVEPRKRLTFIFDSAQPLGQTLPLTIDPSGVHVRSDGPYFMAGCAPFDDRAVAYDDFEDLPELWEERVWPAIAERIPSFDRLKLMRSWVGHYAYNTLDQNAVVGPHPDLSNFYFANGFSGHGLQQSPAIGRGLAELIATGAYQSLDLTAFSYQRLLDNRPLIEKAVI